MSQSATDVAQAVSAVFAGVFDMLAGWSGPVEAVIAASTVSGARERVVVETGACEPSADGLGDAGEARLTEPGVATELHAMDLDAVVADLVLPHVSSPDPLLVGAGFIADGRIIQGRDVHFAWWLGPLSANPVLGRTIEPTRLDLSSRGYTGYLRDFRSLEWYREPTRTGRPHVTGPYVDHVCTCEYTLTLTTPVRLSDGNTVGVLGADVTVRRLERELLAAFLDVAAPLALVNAVGRVVLSTEPTLQVGQLAELAGKTAVCAGTSLTVLVEPTASAARTNHPLTYF